jgi:hypothetical protein
MSDVLVTDKPRSDPIMEIDIDDEYEVEDDGLRPARGIATALIWSIAPWSFFLIFLWWVLV